MTRITTLSLFILILIGCTKQPELQELDQNAAFRRLKTLFDSGDYFKAAEGLDYYTLNFSGSAVVDSAQLLLAWSHYHMDEYLIAASSFEELTRRFPRSPLAPEAMFMIGVCNWKLSPRYALDQEYTNRCVDAFQAFIDYYPNLPDKVREAEGYIGQCREKLAHKEYATGVIYLKMKDWRAAGLYFRKVTDQFYDTPWAAPAAFQIARSLAAQGLSDQAAEAYRSYLSKYPDHDWRTKAASELKDLAGKAGG